MTVPQTDEYFYFYHKKFRSNTSLRIHNTHFFALEQGCQTDLGLSSQYEKVRDSSCLSQNFQEKCVHHLLIYIVLCYMKHGSFDNIMPQNDKNLHKYDTMFKSDQLHWPMVQKKFNLAETESRPSPIDNCSRYVRINYLNLITFITFFFSPQNFPWIYLKNWTQEYDRILLAYRIKIFNNEMNFRPIHLK